MKSWVIYNHPTTFGTLSKPSKLLDEYLAVASVYVANNYGVIMNDYFGLS